MTHHPYWLWEDYAAGMYAIVPSKHVPTRAGEAALYMVDVASWEGGMRSVLSAWPISAETNLLNGTSAGGRAWLGQAAMCFLHGCPASITKNAWWRLSFGVQQEANHVADVLIKEYRTRMKRGER